MKQFARVKQGSSVIPVLVGNTGLLDLRPLIADITAETLPGDILATGTPPGVSMGKNRFLAPGDLLECGVAHLGAQRHEIVP
jgi:2-keto-4-pentenoate hydratase/2-oxohepta-3-ene-1,7-dioic acid hydratase in catechol pathway